MLCVMYTFVIIMNITRVATDNKWKIVGHVCEPATHIRHVCGDWQYLLVYEIRMIHISAGWMASTVSSTRTSPFSAILSVIWIFFYSIFHAAIELIDGSAVHTALSVASYDTFWVCHCGMIAGHRAHNVRFTHTQWLLLMICTFWYSPMCPTKYCDWQPLWQLWLHIENTNIICHAILWSVIPIVWYVVICRSPCAAQNPSNNTRFWYASSESEFNAKWY